MNKCSRCKELIEHMGACDPCVAWFKDKSAKETVDRERNVWEFHQRPFGKRYREGADGFPYLKHNPALTQANRDDIATLRNWDQSTNLYFHGKSGTGKTYLAQLLAEKAFEAKARPIGLLRCAGFQQMAFDWHPELGRLLGCHILIIDDIDKLQTFSDSLARFHDWIDKVRARLIITANVPTKELTGILAGKARDYARAEAITSRLEPYEDFLFKGPDLRRRGNG